MSKMFEKAEVQIDGRRGGTCIKSISANKSVTRWFRSAFSRCSFSNSFCLEQYPKRLVIKIQHFLHLLLGLFLKFRPSDLCTQPATFFLQINMTNTNTQQGTDSYETVGIILTLGTTKFRSTYILRFQKLCIIPM